MSTRRLSLVQDAGPPDGGSRLRVAVASQDGKNMNAHFGSARRFVLIDVSPTSSQLRETVFFDDVSDESGSHREEDRIGAKVDALLGTHLLFVLAIGGPAAAKVVRARIHPVKLAAPESIDSVIAKVQELMRGTPPPWLRRALAASQTGARSMRFLEEDEP